MAHVFTLNKKRISNFLTNLDVNKFCTRLYVCLCVLSVRQRDTKKGTEKLKHIKFGTVRITILPLYDSLYPISYTH